jgi:hypothetical protein
VLCIIKINYRSKSLIILHLGNNLNKNNYKKGFFMFYVVNREEAYHDYNITISYPLVFNATNPSDFNDITNVRAIIAATVNFSNKSDRAAEAKNDYLHSNFIKKFNKKAKAEKAKKSADLAFEHMNLVSRHTGINPCYI